MTLDYFFQCDIIFVTSPVLDRSATALRKSLDFSFKFLGYYNTTGGITSNLLSFGLNKGVFVMTFKCT